jgi:cytoskeleton protein RodZ
VEVVAEASKETIREVFEQPPRQERSGVVKSANASVPVEIISYEGSRSRIQILALQDTWVMITDKDNHLLMEGVIRTGERYTPPAIPGLRLTTSNAGGLELTVDGRTLAPLGEKGVVVRSVLLDPKRQSAGGSL